MGESLVPTSDCTSVGWTGESSCDGLEDVLLPSQLPSRSSSLMTKSAGNLLKSTMSTSGREPPLCGVEAGGTSGSRLSESLRVVVSGFGPWLSENR